MCQLNTATIITHIRELPVESSTQEKNGEKQREEKAMKTA